MGFTLKINDRFRNRKIDFFNEFSLTLKHDSIGSVFGFNIYFDPQNPEHKELACVTHFHEVTLFYDDELLVTGVLTNQAFSQSTVKELAKFGGYSLTGVLEDCTIPPKLYPLQTNGLSLSQIVNKILPSFKLKMIVDSSVSDRMNKPFKTVTASETQTIKDFLVSLASQKNIIISHTEKGELLFTETKTKQDPILKFDLTKQNVIPGTKFEHSYDGQSMHSHITVMKQASLDGGNAGQVTIRNPYVIGSVYRPIVRTQSSGDDNDTNLAARKELANELRGEKLTITTDRWVVDGKIIKPNNIIEIYAPELYLYKKTRWFVESINFSGNNKSTTAVIECVLPEVYNSENVESMYRNINLHA